MEIDQIQSSVSSEGQNNTDIICGLLQRPFSSRNTREQKEIGRMDRPMPNVLIIKTRARIFQQSWFTRKDWLCASIVMKSLFCWPCLLFCPGKSSTWTHTGYVNMHHFSCDCQKHEKAKSHMEAYKMWKTFDKDESVDVLLSRARKEAVERYNEEVRKNREMLKNITEAVLYLSKQEMAFRGHDESNTSLNQGNYRELLKSYGKLDSVFDRRIRGQHQAAERPDSGGVFTGVSADVQNDLIECIDAVIQDQIDKEIGECEFFTIQCDETSDVSTKEQLSVIIRLDRKGEIVERFLKFKNCSSDRCAQAICDIVKKILERYGESLKAKLVMQTYDGAAVMSGHLGGLQTLIRQEYPYAFFFHCAAHRLNLVLCQSALNVREVNIFFAKVSAFCTFDNSSPERKAHLKSHGVDVPSPSDTRWYYKSRTVSAVFDGYAALVTALSEIVHTPQSWNDDTVSWADGLLNTLNSFLFCFLLELYYKILKQSAILYAFLQNRSTDFSFGVGKIQGFVDHLTNLRNDAAFDTCYAAAESRAGAPATRSERSINYKQLYNEVIDCIVGMVNERFSDVESFSFLDLVNPKIFSKWQDKVPADKLQLLIEKYGPLFNIPMLESQLMFVYKDNDFLKETPMELLQYIYDLNLQQCFPEFVKLLKLNAVIAVSSASAERSFSCLGRVKSYLRSKMGDERMASLCRISIHKDILKEKEDQKQLHDLILQKFIAKPRRLNFLYK